MSKSYDGNTIAQIVGIDRDIGFDFTIIGHGRLQNGWRCFGIGKTHSRQEAIETLENACGEGYVPEDIWRKTRNGKELKIHTVYWVNFYSSDVIGIGLTEQDAVNDANDHLDANGYTLSELTDEPEVED